MFSRFCFYHTLVVQFGNFCLGESQFLQQIPIVLAQKRRRDAFDHLGIAESDIVAGDAQLSDFGMLMRDDHIVGRGMWVVEEEMTISRVGIGTRDACLV